jgi:CheY-like chemotaxis protein
MNPDSAQPKSSQNSAPPAGSDFARRIAKARHDLRNPVAHILGFSEMLIEKAHEQGYNFLKGRVELIERLGNEMVEQINDCLDPQKIAAGQSHVPDLQQLLRKHSSKIAVLTETLGRKPLVRQDDKLSGDLSRIGGAAQRILELSETALAFLLEDAGERHAPSLAATPKGAGPASKHLGSGLPTAPEGAAVRILVVDDESQHRAALRDLLVRLGYAVELAESGSQGLQSVAAQPVDLVLLDLTMPGLDGLQTLQKLKAQPITRELPVLMLSGADEVDLAIRAIGLGADDYVSKPFHPVVLQARVASSLARQRLRDLTRSR